MIVTGCVAQAENQEMIRREPYIDLVIGPQAYHKINDSILKFRGKKKIEETNFDAVSKFEYLSRIKNQSSKSSSFLTIQEGCDKFCNFCVVPYTRGPEYSRPYNQIIDEAKNLASRGASEIILLGQNVNAYNDNRYRLSDLIYEIEKIKQIKRIRYTTSHPKDMTEDLIDVYKYSKKLMPLVHLPVQSGSNKILELMNRKHSIKEYVSIYDKLKKVNPAIKFSSDFIIAYPGEEDFDFKETINLIKRVEFINSFSFIFSPRPGTTAENLEEVNKNVAMRRLKIIQKILLESQTKMNKSLENQTIDILVENRSKNKTKLFGRSEYMTSVLIEGSDDLIGKIVKVKIFDSNRHTLFGYPVSDKKQKVA